MTSFTGTRETYLEKGPAQLVTVNGVVVAGGCSERREERLIWAATGSGEHGDRTKQVLRNVVRTFQRKSTLLESHREPTAQAG